MTTKKDDFAKFLAEQATKCSIIEYRVANSTTNVAKLCFSNVTKLRNAGLPNGMESNGLNLFSRIGLVVEQGLWHIFIASNNSQFLNKTDLEQDRFKIN